MVLSTPPLQPFDSLNWNLALGDVENIEPEAQVVHSLLESPSPRFSCCTGTLYDGVPEELRVLTVLVFAELDPGVLVVSQASFA